MIVMDRENIFARGWSHVLSTENDLAELRAFCTRVGAPAAALHLGSRWPHLDLKLQPRQLALACSDVRVFERTCEMLRFLHGLERRREPGRTATCDTRHRFVLPREA